MKLCKDCKYFSNMVYCHSPSNGISPVDGNPIVRFASTNRKSSVDMLCGPNAIYFEEKEVYIKRPWYKFWG